MMRAERGTPSTESQMRSPGPSSPVEVRQAVRRALEGRARGRHTADDDEAVSDALLVASELTTNAMLHGGGVTDFEVTPTDGEVRLSVSDRSDELPVETPRTDDIGRIRVGGNGWMIVCRLASDIVISKLRAGGKRITAVVPLSPRTTG